LRDHLYGGEVEVNIWWKMGKINERGGGKWGKRWRYYIKVGQKKVVNSSPKKVGEKGGSPNTVEGKFNIYEAYSKN